MPEHQQHVVIIGNGIAGITAARHIRKFSEKKITVISGENDYFFARTALMYVFMGQMRWKDILPYENWFWNENRIGLKKAWVRKIETSEKLIHFDDGNSLGYDKLILATGSVPSRLGCKGEELPGVQGLVSKQDLELLEENIKHCEKAVIAGGGLIGVELAEMLRSRGVEVSMLVREEAFWRNVLPSDDAAFISNYLISQGLDIQHNTEVESITQGRDGRVSSVVTSDGKEFPCELVGISIGVIPNIEFVRSSAIDTRLGILTDEYLRTNIEDVYAIGDCVQQKKDVKNRSAVGAIWYTARMMGETVAQTICGNPFRYNPGHWFNSAKFFDVEYQTYGRVSPEPTEEEHQLHWEHPSGKIAVTIAFEMKTRIFSGINTFGIRMRHEVMDRWLTEERDVDFVILHLKNANFDPEFYDRHEKDIFDTLKDRLSSKQTI